MKFTTLHTKKFAGEYWNYTSDQGVDGEVQRTYFKVKDLRFHLSAPEKGVMYLYADEQLRYNSQVRNLTDSQGNPVFVDPVSGIEQLSYIGISEPVFDVYGTVMGYRHDLSQGL